MSKCCFTHPAYVENAYLFLLASTIQVGTVIKKPKIASYYTPGLLHQTPTQFSSGKRFVYKRRNNIDVNHIETTANVGMPHHLIYELAQYKHIPRISFLTCPGGNGSPTRKLREQTRTSINIDTLTILRSFFTGKDNRWYKGYTIDGVNISNSSSSSDRYRRRRFGDFLPKGVLIKVLRIDLLINRQAGESFANKTNIGDAASDILETFLRSEVLRQIVVLNLSCSVASQRVIEMASNKGLFNSSYHWLLIEDYAFNRKGDDNDGFVRNDSQLPQDILTGNALHPEATVSTSSRNGKINSGRGRDDSDNFVSSHATEGKNSMHIEKLLQKINININTELILAKRINESSDSEKDYYMLYDVWNPGFKFGGTINITEIGNFSNKNGLRLQKWYHQSTTIIRRMDMKNAPIRCMIVITNKNHLDSLINYLTQPYDVHLDSMHRCNFNLLSYVQDLFNFSLVMSRTPSWGYQKNGKWDGMIGALVRGEADIGGSPIFFRTERAKVIDCTTKTWIARPCFVFRHPRSIRTDQVVFLQPFVRDVWILVAVFGAATIVLLVVLTIVEQKINEEQRAMRTSKTHNLPQKKCKKKPAIEINPPTLKNTMPFAQLVSKRETSTWFTNTKRADGSNNAITMKNEKFYNRTNIKKNQQVSADYIGAILTQSEIDCIGNGVRYSEPIKKHFSFSKTSQARGTIIGKTLSSCFMKFFHKNNDKSLSKNKTEIAVESMLFYIGSICQQGLSVSTNLLSCRCVVITSLLFSFCIYQFYSASIVGTLLMEKPKTIKTLRDIMHSSLEIGIEDVLYNRDYFWRTKDPDAIQLYAKKVAPLPIPHPSSLENKNETETLGEKNTNRRNSGVQSKSTEASNWFDAEYGVARIKQGGFAFHVDVAGAYKIISDTFTEKEICELSEIELYPPQRMVNIVRKGSPFKKIITYGLRRSTEAGLMDYQRKVWHSPKPRCVKQIHTDDLRVDMQTFTSAVFVLIFGFAASIVVLALEMVHNNLWQQFAT